MSLSTDYSARQVLAIANSSLQSKFFDNATHTNEELHSEISQAGASTLDLAGFTALLDAVDTLFAQAAYHNWSQAQVDKAAREVGASEEQAAAYASAWGKERTAVHSRVAGQSRWNQSLKDLSWRVDVASKSRQQATLNTPYAIVEMSLGAGDSQQASSVLRFEMDKEAISEALSAVDAIQQVINAHM